MNASVRASRQNVLHERIRARATELGDGQMKVRPIFDGVVDWAGYLAAPVKICWILKEPYAEADGAGNPAGGGWTMFRDFAEGETLASSTAANKTLANVAYASWGLLEGKGRDADIPWIRNCPEVADALLRVCYLNTGKMPAGTATPDSRLRKIHAEWRGIVLDQIALADPDLIVFAGTLQVWANDFGLDITKPILSVVKRNGASRCVADIHLWHGKRVLWVNHPSLRCTSRENWVDSLLEAARLPLQ